MSRNAYFYYMKSTFFDIITYHFNSYDSRKTNNSSFECPSKSVQNTRRTDLQLFQGLSCNLSFKKCVFYQKGCVTVPDRATQLSLTYFDANIKEKNEVSFVYVAWVVLCQILFKAKL